MSGLEQDRSDEVRETLVKLVREIASRSADPRDFLKSGKDVLREVLLRAVKIPSELPAEYYRRLIKANFDAAIDVVADEFAKGTSS